MEGDSEAYALRNSTTLERGELVKTGAKLQAELTA
jgi:hypothetical protein